MKSMKDMKNDDWDPALLPLPFPCSLVLPFPLRALHALRGEICLRIDRDLKRSRQSRLVGLPIESLRCPEDRLSAEICLLRQCRRMAVKGIHRIAGQPEQFRVAWTNSRGHRLREGKRKCHSCLGG